MCNGLGGGGEQEEREEDIHWSQDGAREVRSGPATLLDGELGGAQLRCAVANHREVGMQLRSAEPEMEMQGRRC